MTLSTHVLDATTGRPAAGVEVRLDCAVGEKGGEGGGDTRWAPAGAGQTDADGRLRLASQGGAGDFEPGVYRITFGTGAYFKARGTAAFYPEVAITFTILESPAGQAGHFHVPLLLSPYAYSTYRGS